MWPREFDVRAQIYTTFEIGESVRFAYFKFIIHNTTDFYHSSVALFSILPDYLLLLYIFWQKIDSQACNIYLYDHIKDFGS